MADARRVIEIFLDTSKSLQVDAVASFQPVQGSKTLTFYRNTVALVRAHLLTAPSTYLQPAAGATWFFAIDNSFDPSSTDTIVTNNDQFNVASYWGELDPDNGKIAFRVDTTSTQLQTRMGTDARLGGGTGNNAAIANSATGARAELWYTAPGETSTLVCQWDVYVLNIVSDIGGESELEFQTNGILRQVGQTRVELLYADGTLAQSWEK